MSRTILFFDDMPLERRANLQRHIGRPHPVAGGVFEDPHLDVNFAYPSVHWDERDGCWRMYHMGVSWDGKAWESRPVNISATAVSDDGVDWRIDDLTKRVKLAHRRFPHQLVDVEDFVHADRVWGGVPMGMVYRNDRATDERLRFVACGAVPFRPSPDGPAPINRSVLLTSPDGLHWETHLDTHWHPTGSEGHAMPYWNPHRGCYAIPTRPGWGMRRVALIETADWHTFTEPTMIVEPDALDTPHAQVYGMPVYPYDDYFIGLLWIYHTNPAVDAGGKSKGGTIDCQLAYSTNGVYFKRALRDAFIGLRQPGEYGSTINIPSGLVVRDDGIMIYSCTARQEHAVAPPRDVRNSAILTYRLRRDGFCYLQPDGGYGRATTRRMVWMGNHLSVNAAVPDGELRVQITDDRGQPIAGYTFDECQPLHGDELAWAPRWTSGHMMTELADRPIRIDLQLFNGRLYAIRGDFDWPAPAVFGPPEKNKPLQFTLKPYDGMEAPGGNLQPPTR